MKCICKGETKVLQRFRLKKDIIVHDSVGVVEVPGPGGLGLVVGEVYPGAVAGSGGAGEGEDGAEVLRDLERNGVEVVAVIWPVSEPGGLRELVVEVVLSPTVQIKLLLRLRSSLI